jgi:hypothetical protein
MGSPPLIALLRKKKLKLIQARKLIEGHSLEKFSEYFNEIVKPISNSPPMTRNNQGIILNLESKKKNVLDIDGHETPALCGSEAVIKHRVGDRYAE